MSTNLKLEKNILSSDIKAAGKNTKEKVENTYTEELFFSICAPIGSLKEDAINNLMNNRTSIVIAHRLSTIRHANEIVVLQKGEIVERGTHDELITQNGFYKRLVDMQEVK